MRPLWQRPFKEKTAMSERTAVYAGSFDPPTYGHLDLIQRAQKMFDRLVVAVARNSEKNSLFTVDERIEMLKTATASMGPVEVASFEGLTVEFGRTCKAIALVRGLRVMSDFEYELTMAVMNQKLAPDIDTVCLMPSEKHMVVSSRLVREIALNGGDVGEFVPPEIARKLTDKINTQYH
jgi:pantetheine-phosphate adenylyltransferase